MSAALQQTAEGFLTRYEGIASRLPGASEPRRRAAAAFRARGLPDTRLEAWRFTSLRPLAGTVFADVRLPEETARRLLARVPATDRPLLVFANGRFLAGLSRPPEGIGVSTFAAAPSFGAAASEADPVGALNTMLAEDGAVITVPDGVDGGALVLLHVGGGEAGRPIACHPHHRIRLGRGARLELMEIALGEGNYLHNPVMDIALANESELLHLSLQNESPSAFRLGSLRIVLGARARYQGCMLVCGALLARSEIHTDMAGEAAGFTLSAAQLLEGEQHTDITTVVRHEAPAAISRQTVKNVLTGRSCGVFQGRIAVARCAQKTDGYQRSQTLLLSDHAEVKTKPELEIFADDVKCSHGATVGALDADQLFYLQSRGVPKAEARAILVRAFLAETFEAIPDGWGRSVLEGAVESWWKDRPV